MKKQKQERFEGNERETEDTPLTVYIQKAENLGQPQARESIINIKIEKQTKRNSCLHTQVKVVLAVLCLLVVLLVGINFLVVQKPQMANNTNSFNSVEKQQKERQAEVKKKVQPIITNQSHPNNQQQQTHPQFKNQTKWPVQFLQQLFQNAKTKASLTKATVAQSKQSAIENKKIEKPPEKPSTLNQQKKKTQAKNTLSNNKNRPKIIAAKYKANTAKNKVVPARGRQVKKKKAQQGPNILSNITKNPYYADNYSMLNKSDLKRAMKWRTLTNYYYGKKNHIQEQELKHFLEKYRIGDYQELPFCIIIPTFNNKARRRAQLNIKSILMQNYSNYRVAVMDDGSSDGTLELIQSILSKQKSMKPERYRLQKNKQRQFALPNILSAAKDFCRPSDILVVVDGDDELIGRQVLKLLNSVFQKDNVWFMYTNFITSVGSLGYSRPYPEDIISRNAYRDYGFTVTHLRAFYTQLLLNIKDQDLRDEKGGYFTAAGDMAVVVPCLEQAHDKVKYVPEITYLYNVNTGQNIHKKRREQQRINNLKIRAKNKYVPLQRLF